jgi:hypothetical protein
MKGDFSRDTFDKSRNYSGVLMQQGRVQLDADWNEQARIILHLLRALAADLFGPFGGPKPPGFRISDVKPKNGRLDFTISRGHYYVDGILCDAAADASYSDQPYFPWGAAAEPARFYLPDPPFLVYLDVWERFVSAVEDPSLREVALNGPDTAGRTQVVFQVKAVKIGQLTGAPTCQNFLTDTQTKGIWERLSLTRVPAGRLKARARRTTPADASDACAIPPEASYRGSDNRNYRVEVHNGGRAGTATFKWSRENGSLTYPAISISGATVTLEHLGRDESLGLHPGDWVEVVNDDYTLLNYGGQLEQTAGGDYVHRPQAAPLLRVEDVDYGEMTVRLSGAPAIRADVNDRKHPFLRRWDHAATDLAANKLLWENGAIKIPSAPDQWVMLEDGVQIQFTDQNAVYRAGDYWLIPARTATGNVEWPLDQQGAPKELPPHGVEHHYAPLAIYIPGAATAVADLQRTLDAARCP